MAKTLDASPSSPAATIPSLSVASDGRLVVSHTGALGNNVWSVRIERADGSTEVEQAFYASSISLDRQLDQGKYRVISWSRACSGTCPRSGEIGLGPLANACGGLVHIGTSQRTRVEVAINPDGSCAISKTD